MNTRGWIIATAVILALVGGVVAAWYVFVRQEPPTIEIVAAQAPVKVGEKVIAQAPKGQRFRLLGARGPWYQVKVRVGGEEKTGWIHVSHAWRIDPKRKPGGPLEAQVIQVAYPDAVLSEFPPSGKRWLVVEVQVRALEADGAGACSVHTDRLALCVQHLRCTKPRYWKTVEVGGRQVDQLLKESVEPLAAGEMKMLRLVFIVPSQIVIRHGWRVDYSPPEPDAAIRLGEPKPSTAAPLTPPKARPSTAAPPAAK